MEAASVPEVSLFRRAVPKDNSSALIVQSASMNLYFATKLRTVPMIVTNLFTVVLMNVFR